VGVKQPIGGPNPASTDTMPGCPAQVAADGFAHDMAPWSVPIVGQTESGIGILSLSDGPR